MYRFSYRFLVPGWSTKPLVSAHDRIMGTHTSAAQLDWDLVTERVWGFNSPPTLGLPRDRVVAGTHVDPVYKVLPGKAD